MAGIAGRYLRVGEAAELLRLAPATVRWYALQGRLPAYRVGQGPGPGHRRFRFDDVAALARELGAEAPNGPAAPRPGSTVDRQQAAAYLGLSDRFLKEAGLWPQGDTLTAEELTALERRIYPAPANLGPEEENMHGRHGPRWYDPRWSDPRWHGGCRGGWLEELEDVDALALRSIKRHLEARKADLEDRLAEVDKRLRRVEGEGPEAS